MDNYDIQQKIDIGTVTQHFSSSILGNFFDLPKLLVLGYDMIFNKKLISAA
jgi:hypothetical protein